MVTWLLGIIVHHYIIIQLLLFTYTTATWDHVIHVNNRNGTDQSESCLNGEVPCATVNKALEGVTNDSTVIYIADGQYDLYNKYETTIIGKNDIAII